MNENMGLNGAVIISTVLAIGFYIFSHRIGALAAFGRRPMSWRSIGALSVASFLPAVGGFGAMILSDVPGATEYPLLLAAAMAMLGWGCAKTYKMLAQFVLLKPDLAPKE